jgi:hypothetical protein
MEAVEDQKKAGPKTLLFYQNVPEYPPALLGG